MTNDSHLFPPRPQWETKGYRPDEYSRWLLGDWRPIEELWEELGVDPSRPEPVEVELEEWLFDTTAGPERREAEARFVHGYWLKPGDVAKTEWRMRCAQPPYDGLPVPRVKIPPGVILSREADSWIREDHAEGVALPLMQGAMLNQFDFSQKGWVSGTGLRARWRPISWAKKIVDAQFLMSAQDIGPTIGMYGKVAFRRVARSTDIRTLIASIVPAVPCGDKAPVLKPKSVANIAVLTMLLNSFTLDTLVRLRIGATQVTQVDYHYARELPLVPPAATQNAALTNLALSLNCASGITSPDWCHAMGQIDNRRAWRTNWAITEAMRLRHRAVSDALVASLQGLDTNDLHAILTSCDHDEAQGDVKGFWRIDKEKDPELRHTVLSLIAFNDLESKILTFGREKAMQVFLTQNYGEGWMLPETLRLADYGLGHDDRANQRQPVASRLGPRFYDWQLVQSADESWRECHLHSRNLLGAHGYAMLLVDLIERRTAEGADYLDILTDSFIHKLVGKDGYVTILLEIRARKVLYEDVYWTIVADLRNGGHLNQDGYGQLLDRLHARKLLNDLDYRGRSGRDAPAPKDEPLLQVAERGSDYGTKSPPKGGQKDLFE